MDAIGMKRTRQAIGILVAALLVLAGTALPALAAEDGHGASTPFSGNKVIDAVVTLVIFALVLIILGRFAWGPLLRALQDREKFIEDSLAKAKEDREQAEARLKEYTDKLDSAREEATAIVEEGKRDAEAVKRRIEGDARTEADAIIVRARREIEIARDDAIKELYEQTAELATSVAGRIISKSLNPDDHRTLVNEAIKQIETLPPEGSSN
jgi:F-type H+-transporting ATPase subunit b